MTLLRGLLVLSLSCLQGPCSVFSPVSAMEPLDQQVMGVSPVAWEPGGPTALKRSPGDCKGAPTPEETRRLAQAIMSFTADLFSLVAQSSTSPNLILSPLSVALALSHLALGTVAAPIQTSRTERPVGTHYSRGYQWMKSFTIELQHPQPFFNLKKPLFIEHSLSPDTARIKALSCPVSCQLAVGQEMLLHLTRIDLNPSLSVSKSAFWTRLQVAHFPFKNNMSFVVMVPTHFEWNVSRILANLSWDTLHQPLLRERPTKVRLPKLHLKHHLDLVTTLSQLGLQELFQSPDLRGISDERLVVSSVQHQSTLELSEAGVEAAAATSTAMSRMSLSSFSVNRPFLFFILEDTTGLPLFVGSVRNPNPGAQPELQEQQDSPDSRDSFQDQKAFLHRDKPFGPDLKLMPPSEEDYSEFNSPK
uniref:Serpin family F member 2 n=1 Tax=Ictidomys tridecemlineatus TaxID=43179 RepID=I3M5Q0_ICTTR